MAKEDLLANLLVNLTTSESNSTETDDNTLIQKMIAPNDSTQLADGVPNLTKLYPSTFVWGGAIFNQGSFSRNSNAYDSSGNLYGSNTPRFQPAKFGNGVTIEEGTTNIIASSLTFSGWSAYGGTTVTLTQGQAISGITTNGATRIQTSGGSGPDTYLKYYYSYGVGVAGSPASISVWIYNCGTNPVLLTGNEIGGSVTVNAGETKYCTLSKASISGVGAVQLRFSTASGRQTDSLDFIAFHPQIEWKAYATSFIDSVRQPETLTIPTTVLNPTEGTIEFNFALTSSTTTNGNVLLSVGNDLNHTIEAWVAPTGWSLRVGYGSSANVVTFADGSITVGANYQIAIKYNNTGVYLFVNGVKRITNSYVWNKDSSPLYLGSLSFYGGGYQLNGIIDNSRISSISRSDSDILAGYNSNQPLPVDQYTTAKLNFDGNLANIAYIQPNWKWGQGQWK